MKIESWPVQTPKNILKDTSKQYTLLQGNTACMKSIPQWLLHLIDGNLQNNLCILQEENPQA